MSGLVRGRPRHRLLRAVVLVGDEPSVSAQDRFGCHDTGNVGQEVMARAGRGYDTRGGAIVFDGRFEEARCRAAHPPSVVSRGPRLGVVRVIAVTARHSLLRAYVAGGCRSRRWPPSMLNPPERSSLPAACQQTQSRYGLRISCVVHTSDPIHPAPSRRLATGIAGSRARA
jgi:hypothetical protein